MNDQVTLATTGPLRPRRSIILMVDCLGGGDAGEQLFAPGSEGLFFLRLASTLASGSGGRVMLCSVLSVPEGGSVSALSTVAQSLRQRLERWALTALQSRQTQESREEAQPLVNGAGGFGSPSLIVPVVRVASQGEEAQEVRRFLASEPDGLLLLPLRPLSKEECPWLRKALRSPLQCDVAWARPPLSSYRGDSPTAPFEQGMRVLLPARGGPQAMLALDLSQDLMAALHAQVTVLHVLQEMPERARAAEEAPFAELVDRMLRPSSRNVPPRQIFTAGSDPVESIGSTSVDYDLVMMGAGGERGADVGKFTERVAERVPTAVLALKTRVPVGPAIQAARKRGRPHALAPAALSLLVDKWFAENTFHAEEFSDLGRLVDLKRKSELTVSVGLPALNEEATIGGVIRVLKETLMRDAPLLDELVVIDSNSTDCTREIAAELGVPVYIHQQVLPEAGPPLEGKGEALWKSLHVLKGDIIAWVDTDIENMQPHFVYGLLGPLLRESRIGFVKGYYHRPIQSAGVVQHEGGGRVTELTVRPLLNLFYPLLSGLVQPLAGEYAGRREVLEQIPFFSGYGVETGMLIDLLERFGLPAIGQVNLESRIHRNRTLGELSLTAFAIVQVILSRLEERAHIRLLEEVNRSMKLIRFEGDHLALEVQAVRDVERPPIITVPGYVMGNG
jgi:nucleotide-binding universal stress UspA family protein